MASEKAKRAAAARLKKLDEEYEERERNKLRTQVSMGSRAQRREAASKLSGMPKQRRMAKALRD